MSLSRETVLIVEDDASDALLLKRALERLPEAKLLQVVTSGEQAIAYLKGRDQFSRREEFPVPTLIFLDLKLPDFSGFEVLTWIRQQPHLEHTRVVVLTGSRKSLDVYRAFELGANSYLAKPIRADDLAGLAQGLRLPWLSLAQPPPLLGNAPDGLFDRAP